MRRYEVVELPVFFRTEEEAVWRNLNVRIFGLFLKLSNDVGQGFQEIMEAIKAHEDGMLDLNKDKIE